MSIETILSSLNKQAMEQLCMENYAECFKLLRKAEVIIDSPEYSTGCHLKGITWNNLGVYCKQINQLDQALAYLQKSLNVNESDHLVKAETHLNILAVLIKQRRASVAVSHGMQAINLLKGSAEHFVLLMAMKTTAEAYLSLGKLDHSFKLLSAALHLGEQRLSARHELVKEIEEKLKALRKIEKKFIFEKVKLQEGREFLSHFRGNGRQAAVKETKSLERSPKQTLKQVHLNKRPLNPTKTLPLRRKLLMSKLKQTKVQQFEALEGKIQDLQSQLKDFESRYKQLEKVALSLSPRPNKAGKGKESKAELRTHKLMLQQGWEQDPRLVSREKSKQKARRALVELETLQKQVKREDLLGFEVEAETGAQNAGGSAMYKTFGYLTHGLLLRP